VQVTAAHAELSSNIATVQDQTYDAQAQLLADAVLRSQTGNVNLKQTVDGAYNLQIQAALQAVFGGAVGAVQKLQSVQVTAAETVLSTIATAGATSIVSPILTINTGAGDNVIAINGSMVTINGAAEGLTGVRMLTINSGGGSDTTNILATQASLVLNTGDGNDTVNVQSIGAPASINAGAGNDVINVFSNVLANSGTLSGIAGLLTVNGGTGSTTVNVSDTGDSAVSTSTLSGTTLTSTAFAAGGSLSYSSITTLNVSMGRGGNTFTVAGTVPGTTTTVNSGTGNDTVNLTGTSSSLTVNTQAGTDTVNVQSIGAPASINAGGGNDAINVFSSALANGGTLSGIAGLLTVNGGSGSTTVNVSDTGDRTASTSTLSATTLTSTAFAAGGGLSYSSIATLNVSLGGGGGAGNSLKVTVPAGQDLPGTTSIVGGSAGKDQLSGNWATNFNGTFNLQGFASASVTIGSNFNGSMTDQNPGEISSIRIGGSLTSTGMLHVSGDIGSLLVGPAPSTPTTGDVNDVAGRVMVGGSLTTANVLGNVSGTIQESLTISTLYIGGSLTSAGLISAVNAVTPSLGNINSFTIGGNFAGTVLVSGTLGTITLGGSMTNTASITLGSLNNMTIQGDMAGQLNVSNALKTLIVHGGTPGTITASQVGVIEVYAGYGSFVAQIAEAGTQRLIEATTPSNPSAIPAAPPAPPPPPSPAGVTFAYLYEGTISPTVEGLNPATNLANPQVTIRVANATGSTAPDQFDLSLVTYNHTAKFNLSRLDAAGNSGVSGIRNVAVEGDILTKVTAGASAFFAPDSSAAGIYLPHDNLAGVGVRDYVPNHSINAKSIQAVAFGSHTATSGLITTGAAATASDVTNLLAVGTAIVQAGSSNGTTVETFRVPFADLATQQVGFFMSDSQGGGHFDGSNVVLVVQSVLIANSSGTNNTITASNVARGAVIALITVAETYDQGGHLQQSIIQTIGLRGDGGSIQTQQAVGSSTTSPKVPFTPAITSTGPLGDVIIQGPLPNVTAPSIFGSLLPGGPIPATTTIQTTGIRTDPITGASSQVPADLGRVYVTTTNQGPVLTTTVVHSFGPGVSGQVISRGNLISQVLSDGGITGLVAAQGDLGAFFTYPSGQVVRLGGVVSNGTFSGRILILGNAIGDIISHGGMQGGRIAVGKSILGNMTINGTLDSQSVLVSGGSIGSKIYGTTLTVGNVYGIVAAEGSINAGAVGSTTTALYYKQNIAVTSPPDAAVIDAIFTQGVSPLSATDLFDRTTPQDLLNLSQMVINLNSLTVKNGNLQI
jgi:hypothetical protein